VEVAVVAVVQVVVVDTSALETSAAFHRIAKVEVAPDTSDLDTSDPDTSDPAFLRTDQSTDRRRNHTSPWPLPTLSGTRTSLNKIVRSV